ncbi:MAG: DUF3179 domain-containing protein [Chloroflexi bacterium]|nr:DUF3179 domain-containing protein [Chloroflexota bacterium]
MHDRRIDGDTYVFGNHGALWMNAMTWWDHQTESIWSQPWGRAIAGPLKGTQLRIIPFSLVPWGTWKAEHPDTLALFPPQSYSGQRVGDGFVAGVAIGDAARAYPYSVIAEAVVINDVLNGIPLLIHTNPETRSIHIFVRQLSDGTELTFSGDAEQLVDTETGSTWDPVRGLATGGELQGQGLREIPYISSFPDAWLDFYPLSDFYD